MDSSQKTELNEDSTEIVIEEVDTLSESLEKHEISVQTAMTIPENMLAVFKILMKANLFTDEIWAAFQSKYSKALKINYSKIICVFSILQLMKYMTSC